MTPVKNQKDYNRIFRKVLFQVLIDPSRSKLFKDICEEKGEKPSAVLRDLAYKYTENNSTDTQYQDSLTEDIELSNKAQQSRIENGFNWTKE